MSAYPQYQHDEKYERGAVVYHRGFVWKAKVDTDEEPGNEGSRLRTTWSQMTFGSFARWIPPSERQES